MLLAMMLGMLETWMLLAASLFLVIFNMDVQMTAVEELLQLTNFTFGIESHKIHKFQVVRLA